MPHCWSPTKLALRRQIATERGYVLPKPSGYTHVLVRVPPAGRVKGMSKGLETTRNLELQVGLHRRSGVALAAAARTLVGHDAVAHFLRVHRDAHTCNAPQLELRHAVDDPELPLKQLELMNGNLLTEIRCLQEELSEWKASWWLMEENETQLLRTIADLKAAALCAEELPCLDGASEDLFVVDSLEIMLEDLTCVPSDISLGTTIKKGNLNSNAVPGDSELSLTKPMSEEQVARFLPVLDQAHHFALKHEVDVMRNELAARIDHVAAGNASLLVIKELLLAEVKTLILSSSTLMVKVSTEKCVELITNTMVQARGHQIDLSSSLAKISSTMEHQDSRLNLVADEVVKSREIHLHLKKLEKLVDEMMDELINSVTHRRTAGTKARPPLQENGDFAMKSSSVNMLDVQPRSEDKHDPNFNLTLFDVQPHSWKGNAKASRAKKDNTMKCEQAAQSHAWNREAMPFLPDVVVQHDLDMQGPSSTPPAAPTGSLGSGDAARAADPVAATAAALNDHSGWACDEIQRTVPYMGAAVLVSGFKNEIYNQRYGRCVSFDPDSKRWAVSFWHDLPPVKILEHFLTVNAACPRCAGCLAGRTFCPECDYGTVDGRDVPLPRCTAAQCRSSSSAPAATT